MSKELTQDLLGRYSQAFHADALNQAVCNAVMTNGLNKSCRNYSSIRKNVHTYSLSLTQGTITSQKQSGRCWLFAAMNVMRYRIIHKCNLKDFELSQNYMHFWDILEKANWFLENILDTTDEPTGSRTLDFLLSAPVSDGGQWDMMANLVAKYGVVPKTSMPESAASESTRETNRLLNELLRGDACRLRGLAAGGADAASLEETKAQMMEEVYRILCIALGEPPKTVDFEVRDKDGNFIQDSGLTPQEFFHKYVDMDLHDYISLINAPTADKPYYRRYTVKMLGNVKEGAPVCYINLPADELKAAAIAQLKDGEPVWFGCDMGPYTERESGVMDPGIYDFEEALHIRLSMTKAERLDYGQSQMTHAMVFLGVHQDENGQPIRWRVENSWGDTAGQKGYFVMSDEWFSEYMYQVVVNKKYLTEAQLAVLDTDTVVLKPWDPMGSLAREQR